MVNPKIQLRHDTSGNWSTINPVLLEGEVGIEIDTGKTKIGDGVSNYNNLSYSIQTVSPLSVSHNIFSISTSEDYAVNSNGLITSGLISGVSSLYPFSLDPEEENVYRLILTTKLRMPQTFENNLRVLFLTNGSNSNFQFYLHPADQRMSVLGSINGNSIPQQIFSNPIDEFVANKDYLITFNISYQGDVRAYLTIQDYDTGNIIMGKTEKILSVVTPSMIQTAYANGMTVQAGKFFSDELPIIYPDTVNLVSGFNQFNTNLPVLDNSQYGIKLNYDPNTLRVVDNKLSTIYQDKTLIKQVVEFPLNLTNNGTLGGTTPSCSGSTYETGHPYYYAFKGATSSTATSQLWGPSSSSENQYLILDCVTPIALNSFRWTNGGNSAEQFPVIVFEGSDDNSNYTTLGTYQTQNSTDDSVTIENNTAYRYYRFRFPQAASYGKIGFISLISNTNYDILNIGDGLSVTDNTLSVDISEIDTLNLVTTDTSQTISGTKSFTSALNIGLGSNTDAAPIIINRKYSTGSNSVQAQLSLNNVVDTRALILTLYDKTFNGAMGTWITSQKGQLRISDNDVQFVNSSGVSQSLISPNCMPDYTLRTSRQAVTWYKTTQDVMVVASAVVTNNQLIGFKIKDPSGNFITQEGDNTENGQFIQQQATNTSGVNNQSVWIFVPKDYSYYVTTGSSNKVFVQEYALT